MNRFDLSSILKIVENHQFKRIALQFPDEELSNSVNVYRYLKENIRNDLDLFITADSSWGSSVDDVSAMHYDADLLIYFGSDLSSSGSIPVIIAPPIKAICFEKFNEAVISQLSMKASRCILLYELGYSHAIPKLVQECTFIPLIPGQTPLFANLLAWQPNITQEICENSIKIGGLLVDKPLLDDSDTPIVYVGEKSEQIVNIILRASSHTVVCYSPLTAQLTVMRGSESVEFRERYGGVLRVKEAKVVGIIIGSMGLTAETTRDIVHRLQTLLSAANKKHYCFVMGRLNESKLCNFPEVDLFCLVSNDDNANIKPKYAHFVASCFR